MGRSEVSSSALLAIGIDLGATKIASVLVTASGEVLEARHCPTLPQRGPAAVLDDIAAEIHYLMERAQAHRGMLLGVGIGSPGQVNPVEGSVRNAVNLGWHEVFLVREVQTRLVTPLPIWIEKDTNAAALGEYYWGAAQGCEDFVFLGIGSGLGGGIIAHGDLVRGADGNAAEVGHIALDPVHGRMCACGLRGCVETVVSGPGLVAVVRRLLTERAYPTRLSAEGELDTHVVVQAIMAGDPLALAALEEVAAAFTTLVAFIVGLLNPARIVIGGGLGLAIFDHLRARLQRDLPRRVLLASHQNLRMVPSQLENPALGAACLVWQATRRAEMKGGDQ